MKFLYLTNERFPTRDAVSIQQMHVVESFAQLGLDVTFIRPYYHDMSQFSDDDIRHFYGIDNNFDMKTIPSLLSMSKPRYGIDIGYGVDGKENLKIPVIGGMSVLASTAAYIIKNVLSGTFDEPAIIYSRNLNSTYVFCRHRRTWLRGKPVKIFVEAHALTQRPQRLFNYIIAQCDGIVSITNALKDDLVRTYNIPPEHIYVAPDGVREIQSQDANSSVSQVRQRLNLPLDKKIVVYSGGFSRGKGVENAIRAAAHFNNDVHFYLLGGAPKTIAEVKKMTNADQYQNVHLPGFIPPRDIASYQAAADVLILPSTYDYSLREYTSPLKLFEYMAAGRPVVASDLPVFREVLRHKENGYLVEANPDALADGIRTVLSHPELAKHISSNAFNDVQKFTYHQRAKNIVNFLEEKTGWTIIKEQAQPIEPEKQVCAKR